MSDGWDGIPADVFVDILRRIPAIPPWPRRRLRLVCRHWRDIIDERAPEPGASVTKVLAFVSESGRYRAFVFDDLTPGRSRELDLEDSGVNSPDASNLTTASMVGTCNGLLCLRRKRGDIAVTNPAIGETITVDLPPTQYCRDELTYSFGYHPATGQYKIVHVPCSEQAGSDLDAVLVFTLGDGSWRWREVPAPAGSSCLLRFGLVSIDGVTYWATKDGEGIMSFDLKDEQIVPVEVPPLPAPEPTQWWRPSCQLTYVGGRLGLVVGNIIDEFKRNETEVWVLEVGSEADWTWVKRFTVLAHGAGARQEIALPHVAHGEHVLTTGEPLGRRGSLQTLGAHHPRQERKMRPCRMVRVGAPRPETTVGVYDYGWKNIRTFAYAETREPLLVYGGKNHRDSD